MASPRSHPQQHSRNMSNNRFAGMIPPLMLVNPSDLQMNGVRVDGSLLSSKTFIDSMTASFSNQHEISPSTPEFIDSPSSTVSADSFMPPTPQQMHQGRFMCPEPSCSYSILGLNTGAELEQHIASGSHIGHPVEFELELNNEDQVAFAENGSMLPAPMWEHKNGDYFALPMQPKGKQPEGHCSCRYCNPHEGPQELEQAQHALELPPAVGGNGFDHRTWQQNMKLEKAMQAVLQQHERMREAEAMQRSIAFANTAQPFGNFYGAPMSAFPVYGNAFAY
ncbi:hypothetical protein ABW19_dt0207049 [Dactylella cylindrospora]|nr:hypothetical protein ABW19_dt0207049 [Dactylella cylindrospora]